jgi:prepilin-type N-terminal cleavage/methylation domain-containing protein
MRRCHARASDGEAGFTLIEMLIAITILSAAMMGITACFSLSLRMADEAKLTMEARTLAQTLLAAADTGAASSYDGVTESGLTWHVRMRPYGTADARDRPYTVLVDAEIDWPPPRATKRYILTTLQLRPPARP